MKLLNNSQLKNRITTLNGAYDNEKVQEALANIVYQTLHGNTNPVNQLNVGAMPVKVRSFLGKYAAVKFNKETERYDYSKDKAEKIQGALELDFKPGFDVVAEALPDFDQKAANTKKPLDTHKSINNLVKRLEKALDTGEIDDKDYAKKVLATLNAL